MCNKIKNYCKYHKLKSCHEFYDNRTDYNRSGEKLSFLAFAVEHMIYGNTANLKIVMKVEENI
nr:hypothetical protein [Clostridium chromiireducens]